MSPRKPGRPGRGGGGGSPEEIDWDEINTNLKTFSDHLKKAGDFFSGMGGPGAVGNTASGLGSMLAGGGGGGLAGALGGGLGVAGTAMKAIESIPQVAEAESAAVGLVTNTAMARFESMDPTGIISGLREGLGNVSAEGRAYGRMSKMAQKFARQGMPLDRDFLAAMGDVTIDQERAASGAERSVENYFAGRGLTKAWEDSPKEESGGEGYRTMKRQLELGNSEARR